MASTIPTLVFGGAATGRTFQDSSSLAEALKVLEEEGVDRIDTAQIYMTPKIDLPLGGSETLFGLLRAGDKFIVDTKAACGLGSKDAAEEEGIVQGCEDSLKRLNMNQVDIFYLHAPHADVAIESTLSGINKSFQKGFFRKFGLSNYSPEQVEHIYNHCESHGFVLPSVFQGNYNPVARLQETQLFPLLRKLNMSFYCYSPIAGGFLTKTKQQIQEGAGRFNTSTRIGQMYLEMYNRPSLLETLEEWQDIAENVEGCSRAELAYRWVTWNSHISAKHGDAVIVGASSVDQLRQTLKGAKRGPLKEESNQRINQIWEKIKHEAPLDNIAR